MYSVTAKYLLNICTNVLCKGLDKHTYSSVLAVKCVRIGTAYLCLVYLTYMHFCLVNLKKCPNTEYVI